MALSSDLQTAVQDSRILKFTHGSWDYAQKHAGMVVLVQVLLIATVVAVGIMNHS